MDFKVHETKVLSNLPRSDEAKRILDKICWQVQPIMQKRHWSVPLVCEMLPRSPDLLGLNENSGSKISIRLRQTKDSDFLPFEDLLGTMLHELVHNDIGPHNAKFYALLDDLLKECENLMSRGVGGSGGGFDIPGKKLSTEAHNPTLSRDARLKGLKAAEERFKKYQLMSGSGSRLGGRPPPVDRTPAQMAAEAALRRLKDEVWCHTNREGSPDLQSFTGTLCAAKSAECNGESVTYATGSATNSKKQPTPVRASSRSTENHPGEIPLKRPRLQSLGQGWQCAVCTLLNSTTSSRCGACDTPKLTECDERNKTEANQILITRCSCAQCAQGVVRSCLSSRSSCPACTYMNAAADNVCAMCGLDLPKVSDAAASSNETLIVLD